MIAGSLYMHHARQSQADNELVVPDLTFDLLRAGLFDRMQELLGHIRTPRQVYGNLENTEGTLSSADQTIARMCLTVMIGSSDS
jgi:hypothetical protein